MKLLLDSHVFLWLLYQPGMVTERVRDAVGTAEVVALSIVSLWELALKHGKGKLPHGPAELAKGSEALNLVVLPLRPQHLVELGRSPHRHGDPFDNMLLAQSSAERHLLVTADRILLSSGSFTLDAR